MFYRHAAVVLAFGIVSTAAAADAPKQETSPPVETLVRQLGSEKYRERDRATTALEKLGAPALKELRKASKSADRETARRAEELVRRIEERVLAEQILAPKKLRLKVSGVSVAEAVAELSKASGYPVQLRGDFAGRTVTLDTGETTFWEALDQLCGKAGLVLAPTASGAYPIGVNPYGPINIVPALPALPPVPPIRRIRIAPPPRAPIVPKLQLQNKARGAALAQVGGFGSSPYPQAPVPPGSPGQIILTPGDHAKQRVSHAGAVRVTVRPALTLPPGAQPRTSDVLLLLEITPEPRLQAQGIHLVGEPSLSRAIDDQGQELNIALAPQPTIPQPGMAGMPMQAMPVQVFNPYYPMPQQSMQRTALLRLRRGKEASKTLKELSGTLAAQVTMPNEVLASLDNVLKGGKVASKGGGTLQVNRIDKQSNGDYRVQVTIEQTGNPLGGNVVINGGGVIMINGNVRIGGGWNRGLPNSGMPELHDAKGGKYQLAGVQSMGTRISNGQFARIATVLYRPQAGQGEPSRMVLYGSRSVSVPISFRFENVPLN